MAISDFLPVLIQVCLAVVIGAVIILASVVVGQRGRKNKIKDTAYECGVPPAGKSRTRYAVKFYVTAMLFILFDIEVVFLIPWLLSYREFLVNSIPIVAPMAVFFGIFILGLVYELKKGAIEWER
ncbi:NADH-quinone oxidoreductase subunit A [Puniceicoccus vermicola]|uniref:NADH-quinone oxidoreductase subunit A n=1 Tax=Puniceicoccus vermicola TaxID=388746 RepID=A0A7X1B1Q2_9BACT|nr:NADH-quinone oxidoreductase subunit A [Puniceicoccus vermicola]MBC2604013.1 NADH-quinone oxidoreductase subunit A [Puniceicoccus vermicola]